MEPGYYWIKYRDGKPARGEYHVAIGYFGDTFPMWTVIEKQRLRLFGKDDAVEVISKIETPRETT